MAGETGKQIGTGDKIDHGVRLWMSGSQAMMERWAQSSNDFVKGASDLAQEIMAFSQTRFRTDLDAWQEMAACRNPADLFERQRQHAETAMTQYFDEVSKLTSQVMNSMSNTTAALRLESTPESRR